MRSLYARPVATYPAHFDKPAQRTYSALDVIGGAFAGAALALAIGAALAYQPAPAKPSTFDLVGIRGTEAYTIDTGISADDCARYVGYGDMRFDSVRCERSA